MNSQQIWQNLLTVAFVGTDQQSLPLNSENLNIDEHDLANLLTKINKKDHAPEQSLLKIAGILAIYHQVGHNPVINLETIIKPCERESLATCDPALQQSLRTILTGQYQEILPECLQLIAQKQQFIPEQLLPMLLDQGKKNIELRPLIIPIIGKRGQWLAQYNSDWDYIDTEFDQTLWETGSQTVRLTLLKQLRQEEPSLARNLIENTWKKEKSEVKQCFLEILEINLSLDDEAFLETLLKDRSSFVKQKVAFLLAKIAQSSFCQRMITRLIPCLIFKADQKPTLEIILPAEYTLEMEQDAIIKVPPSSQGEKAWWLSQMLQSVNPAYWCKTWQISPQTLFDLTTGIWQEILLSSLAIATVNHHYQEMAKILLNQALEKLELKIITQLLSLLTEDEQTTFLLQLLTPTTMPLKSSDLVVNLLQNYHKPWHNSLSLIFIEKLIFTLENAQNNLDWSLKAMFPQCANYISPSLYQELNSRCQEIQHFSAYWEDAIEKFLTRLQFRSQMYS